jgi:hypothetical protein
MIYLVQWKHSDGKIYFESYRTIVGANAAIAAIIKCGHSVVSFQEVSDESAHRIINARA